jgi:hypothetical protein
LPKLSSLKDLVRKGVPMQRRPDVWLALSGGEGLEQLAGADYTVLCSSAVTREAAIGIDEDVATTFRQHALFQTKAGAQALRRLLRASAAAASGYARGTSYAAGLLLIAFGLERERDAFWTLAAMMQLRMYPYAAGQVGHRPRGPLGGWALAGAPGCARHCLPLASSSRLGRAPSAQRLAPAHCRRRWAPGPSSACWTSWWQRSCPGFMSTSRPS